MLSGEGQKPIASTSLGFPYFVHDLRPHKDAKVTELQSYIALYIYCHVVQQADMASNLLTRDSDLFHTYMNKVGTRQVMSRHGSSLQTFTCISCMAWSRATSVVSCSLSFLLFGFDLDSTLLLLPRAMRRSLRLRFSFVSHGPLLILLRVNLCNGLFSVWWKYSNKHSAPVTQSAPKNLKCKSSTWLECVSCDVDTSS